MRTSTVVFDRAGFVLGRPFVLGQLAEMAKLDPERTRHLVAHATAALIAGLAERTKRNGPDADPIDVSDCGSVATVGPCRSWGPDQRLPEVAEIDGERAAAYLLGGERDAHVAELAYRCGVATATAELLVARIAPVVASAIADVRSDLALSDRALTEQLGDEHRTLADLGLVDPPAEPATDLERLATETRNVAKIRVTAPYDFDLESPDAVNRSAVHSSWAWWSAVVVLAMIAVAVLIAPGEGRPDDAAPRVDANGSTAAPTPVTTGSSDQATIVVDTEVAGAVALSTARGSAAVVTVDEAADPAPSVAAESVSAGSAPVAGTELNGFLGLDPITFEARAAVLTVQGEIAVDRVAAYLSDNPDVRVEVGGHTDGDGRSSENLRLSLARAETVVARLIVLGVEADRLVAAGYGETTPAAPNDSAADKARNRRIEFVVL